MSDLLTAVTVVDACGRAGVPALLVSDPGMGKSSLVRGLAAAEQVPCETVLGSLREPADFAGLPVVTEAGVVLDAPAWAKRLLAAESGYLFLDELTTTAPATQAAMLAVALDRTVGDLRLPDRVRVVAGANPPDSAAGGYELEPPLANRFCHVVFAPGVDEWLDGMATGWAARPASRAVVGDVLHAATARSAVIGFARANPTLLDGFSSAAQTGGAWPSRRTWSMVAQVLPFLRDDDTAAVQAVVFGLVGEGAGVEFLTWRQNADLPDPVSVIDDPASFDWGSRPDRVWAVLSGVTAWAAARATVQDWRSAWGPLVAAAEAGAPDVAGGGGAHVGEGAARERSGAARGAPVRADAGGGGPVRGRGGVSGVRALTEEECAAFRLARLVSAELCPYFMHALFAAAPVAAPGLDTFAVDARWRLYLDPDLLVGGRAWPTPVAGAVLLHEVGHLVRQHAERAEGLPRPIDASRWNWAADAEINDDLLAAGVGLPEGVVTPESFGCAAGGVAEDYYAALGDPSSPWADDEDGDGQGCGSGAGGVAVPGEFAADTVGESAGLDEAEADLVRRTVAHAVREAARAGRGSAPAGLQRWAERG